jgi:hypothetical protein
MSTVLLKAGKYFVGNPRTVFPDWEPNDVGAYTADNITYFAFKYDNTYVGAIPAQVIPVNTSKSKKAVQLVPNMTLEDDTPFHCVDGVGYIGKLSL